MPNLPCLFCFDFFVYQEHLLWSVSHSDNENRILVDASLCTLSWGSYNFSEGEALVWFGLVMSCYD